MGRQRRLHFVGIGGAGMSGLALVARELGASVTGLGPLGRLLLRARLREAGIEPVVGHDAANVPAGRRGRLLERGRRRRTPSAPPRERELHRADLLGELTRLRPTIAVSGTHGKTTTSSMLVHALRGSGLDPCYLVGGEVRSTGSNAGWGTGEWLVVEADESDRSLLKLDRRVAVLTNAELDHHATYSSRRDVEATFREFLAAAEHAVVWDRPELVALADGPRACGPSTADRRCRRAARASRSTASTVELSVPGAHNALNAAAALTAVRAIGGDVAAAAAALRDFSGAGRRFEHLGTTPEGALVVDDYAHHPTEVLATLEAARTLAPRRRRRRLPAAPVLAHRALGARVRRRARARRPAGRDRDLSGARARRGLPGRVRAAGGRGGRRRRRRASAWRGCRTSTPPSASCAPSCARAICC